MPNQKQSKSEIDELKEQIQELALTIDRVEDEKLEITNQLKRALADYQNLEKGVDKLIQTRFTQTKKKLAENIIPVIDSLTMAIQTKEDLKIDEKTKAWIEGITQTIDNLEKVFVDIGLNKFVPEKGSIFDPNIHEALTTIEQGEKGCIFDVIQPGYILDNSVIKPARVVVSK
jgi:molecular chaperone GrpE